MATINTNRGRITARNAAEVARMLDANVITGTEAALLQITLVGADPADLIVQPGDPDPRPPFRGEIASPNTAPPRPGPLPRDGRRIRPPPPPLILGGTPPPPETRGGTLQNQRGQDAAIAALGLGGGGSNINFRPTVDPSLLNADAPVNAPRGQSFLSEFLRRRGVGQSAIPLASAAGRFIRSQFQPLEDLFASQGEVAAASGQDQGEFADFTPGIRNIADRSRAGATVLSDFFNLTRDERIGQGLTFERTFGFEGQPEATDDLNLSFLQNLLRQGTRGTRGRIGSESISRRLPGIQREFELNQPGGSFIDFVRNRFGL